MIGSGYRYHLLGWVETNKEQWTYAKHVGQAKIFYLQIYGAIDRQRNQVILNVFILK